MLAGICRRAVFRCPVYGLPLPVAWTLTAHLTAAWPTLLGGGLARALCSRLSSSGISIVVFLSTFRVPVFQLCLGFLTFFSYLRHSCGCEEGERGVLSSPGPFLLVPTLFSLMRGGWDQIPRCSPVFSMSVVLTWGCWVVPRDCWFSPVRGGSRHLWVGATVLPNTLQRTGRPQRVSSRCQKRQVPGTVLSLSPSNL